MPQVPPEIAATLTSVAEQWIAVGAELRIADVAEATGIPRSTLYYYFSGRDDLLAYLTATIVDSNHRLIETTLAQGGSEPEMLERIIAAQLRFLAANPKVTVTLFANLGAAGDLRQLMERTNASFHRPVQRLLQQGQRGGFFKNVVNPETTASALFGAVTLTAVHYLVLDGQFDPAQLEMELVPALLEGLG